MSDTYILDMITNGRHLIPEYMWDGVENYFIRKCPPGGFLRALLEDAPVSEVLAKADDINQRNIVNWVKFLYNYTPSTSHGSKEAVRAWIALEA